MNDVQPLRRREREEKVIKLLGERNLMMRALRIEKFPLGESQPQDWLMKKFEGYDETWDLTIVLIENLK